MSRNSGPAYLVSGVCCSTEEAVLRKALDRTAGSGAWEFNPVSCELRLAPGAAEAHVLEALRVAGFGARRRGAPLAREPLLVRHAEGLTALCAALLTAGGMLTSGAAARCLLGAAIAAGGWRVARRAIGSLRTRALDMNVLMCIAVAGSLAVDRWEEGAAVIVLFAVSLMLESYSSRRTQDALHALLAFSPETAAVIRGGTMVGVPSADVRPGESFLVRPGERVPLDGEVVDGRSPVDESPVTGESEPVEKRPGDTVFAGSLNGTGALTLRALREAGDSAIARIAALVEDAQKKRAPLQTTVDRFARVYTPAVLALAALVALVPPLATGAPFTVWLYRSLVLLVIACPCALVIATPVAFVSALTRAARSGVLIKGGEHIETLARLGTVALDKTGTLTMGAPVVTDVLPVDGGSAEDLIALVAALEQHSEHHIAGAAMREARRAGVGEPLPRVEDFEAIPGMGLRGRIGGTTYYLGSRALADRQGFFTAGVEHLVEQCEGEAKTAVVLGSGVTPLGIVAFRDGARHHMRHIIEDIRALGVRGVLMLSGDRPAAAGAVGADLGIDDVRAGLLPAEKVRVVESLKAGGNLVAMVGDGINDTPALAAASVGVAMGVEGTDAALASADVVLMSDNLAHLPYVMGLSRSTVAIVRQNIAIALAVKLAMILLALAGSATLWMAILADDGAALAVILNALRVLAYRQSGRSHRDP
ncbi:MAG TPA: cation-translocating P-type ATPase [Bacteroidota bacterium]|nr:cation-translocating P-type ATPase [Bacteroidota bacterium]